MNLKMIIPELISFVKLFFHPYYFFNLLLSLSFMGSKLIEPLCVQIFPIGTECSISVWESEVLFFLIVIVMFRTRKSGSRTFFTYIATFSMYAKTCNILLWFSCDPMRGIVFLSLVLAHLLLVGEPVYTGPENLVYFDASGPGEELQKDKNAYWMITFYSSWSMPCKALAPIFAKLSLDYTHRQLKFGKIDVGRFAELAKKYHINDTPLSLQLPTIVLYKGTQELLRRPCLDARKKFQKFYFTEDNIKAAYDLDNIYLECTQQKKSKPSKAKEGHAKSE